MNDFLYDIDEYINKYFQYLDNILYESKDNQETLKKLSIIPTILFYGLPGTGKTSTAHLIYNKLKESKNISKHILRMEQITSYNFGESSKNLDTFFDDIIKDIEDPQNSNENLKALIIIDEIDSFTINRYNCENDSIRRILLTFNKIIDELISTDHIYNIAIIATTNVLDSIDSATLRRFYFKQNFDRELEIEQFKDYIDQLSNISGIKCNLKDLDYFYSVYKNKKFTLGEIKHFFAEQYLQKLCFPDSIDCFNIEKIQNETSYYEYSTNQKEAK